MEYLGNKEILKLTKTAFLSSRKFTAAVVLKSYDWAKQQRAQGNCIICGNHSLMEKDVFEILLRGEQPMILALGRGLHNSWDTSLDKAIQADRLLIVSPFKTDTEIITRDTALVRNKAIIKMADNIVVGYVSIGGQLEEILPKKGYSFV